MKISKEAQIDIREYIELEKSVKWFSKFDYTKDIISEQQREMLIIREKLKLQGIELE